MNSFITSRLDLGDNRIQNFHLGRYIVRYTVGNFRTYIRRYTSPNENFEYGYPHSNALLQSCLKLESCKSHKAAPRPTKCDVINDVKVFLTVYRQDILSQFFYYIQSDVELQKHVH